MRSTLPEDADRRELILGLARRLATHPAIERVWLFGSRARGDHFERSDIDLAIEAPGIDRGEWAMLHLDLEEEADTAAAHRLRTDGRSAGKLQAPRASRGKAAL